MILPLLLGIIAMIISWVASLIYRDYAKKKGLVAKLNFRTLHEKETPKGGGLVVAIVSNLFIYLAWYLDLINDPRTILAFVLGFLISTFGFYDDLRNIKASFKLFFQLLFSLAVLIIVIPLSPNVLNFLNIFYFMIILLVLTWNLNALNFMDGIDGLAASIGTSIFLSSFLIFTYISEDYSRLFELVILGFCFTGFLFVNLSKNKLFMGDSGSLFLGLLINFLLVKTIYENIYTFWFWIILLSYCLTETIATTAYRIIYFKKWYGAHRSHAYQNLARVIDNHFLVSLGIIIYHIFWLAPLALLSITNPNLLALYLVLAIFPVLVFNLFYGPRFSDK